MKQKHTWHVGLIAGEFKGRWSKHITSFENPTYKNSTTLSTYIWKLKEQKVRFEIVERVAPFSAGAIFALLKNLKSCSKVIEPR